MAQVAVAARPREADPELVAFIVPAAPGDTGQLRHAVLAAARRLLPDHMVPSRVVVTPELKRLPGGKIDLQALLDMDEASRAAPRDGGR